MTDHSTLASVAEKQIPQVSIGMPVYNGEKFIREALDSLLAQTFTNFELIISDNSSTDRTEDICREYSDRDIRIIYIRQIENIGAAANFKYVLDRSTAEYFMWAAADDVRSTDYIYVNLEFLSKNIDYVASTSRTSFKNDLSTCTMVGTYGTNVTAEKRLSTYLGRIHANEYFYSIYRTNILKLNPYITNDFFASDWAVVIHTILSGGMNCTDRGFVILGDNGLSRSGNIFRHYRRRKMHWIMPMLELNLIILKEINSMRLLSRCFIMLNLVFLNMKVAKINLLTECKNILYKIFNLY